MDKGRLPRFIIQDVLCEFYRIAHAKAQRREGSDSDGNIHSIKDH